MRLSRGITLVAGTLVVALIILGSSTAYLGYLLIQQRATGHTGNNGLSTGSVIGIPITTAPSSEGSTSTSDPPNSITVSGQAQVSYVPNEALVSVSIVANNRTAQAATQSDAATTGQVIRALNSIGIANSSIQTQGYSLYALYSNNYGESAPPSIASYTVTNSLMVNLTSNDAVQLGLMAGKAIDTAVGAGANQVSLQFAGSSSLIAGLDSEVLRAAVSSASAQAHVIADSLGVAISGVISANEGYVYYPSYSSPYYALASAGVTVNTPILPGTRTVTTTVQVVYSIS